MLIKKTPTTIPATLKLEYAGSDEKLKLDYKFMKSSEFDALVKKHTESGKLFHDTLVALTLEVVDSWECEYPLTEEGLHEIEDNMPGILNIIVAGFHEARGVRRAKN